LSEELATLIDGSRFVLIAGAGHLPNLEQPADFDATIQSFLSVLEGKMQGYRPLNHGI
jgi:3-oxoadipate enol-lactonase